jgi:hypothetical protein
VASAIPAGVSAFKPGLLGPVPVMQQGPYAAPPASCVSPAASYAAPPFPPTFPFSGAYVSPAASAVASPAGSYVPPVPYMAAPRPYAAPMPCFGAAPVVARYASPVRGDIRRSASYTAPILPLGATRSASYTAPILPPAPRRSASYTAPILPQYASWPAPAPFAPASDPMTPSGARALPMMQVLYPGPVAADGFFRQPTAVAAATAGATAAGAA